MASQDPHTVVLFDGHCSLCEATVRFIVRRDIKDQFRFAPLQSPLAQSLLKARGMAWESMPTLMLLQGDHVYVKSSAVLEIVRRLKRPWPLFSVFKILPQFLRDALYDWISRNRYSWFGKSKACFLPTTEIEKKFLK